MTELLNLNTFRAYVANKYYDFYDLSNPVKSYLDDSFSDRIVLGYSKKVQLFVRENRVIQYDSIIPWSSPNEYIFYSVSKSQSTFENIGTTYFDDALAEFVLIKDPQIDIYERRIYNILDMITEIGGMMELTTLIGTLMIAKMNRRAINIELVNSVKCKIAGEKEHQSDELEHFSVNKSRKIANFEDHKILIECSRAKDEEKRPFSQNSDEPSKRFSYWNILWMMIP